MKASITYTTRTYDELDVFSVAVLSPLVPELWRVSARLWIADGIKIHGFQRHLLVPALGGLDEEMDQLQGCNLWHGSEMHWAQ